MCTPGATPTIRVQRLDGGSGNFLVHEPLSIIFDGLDRCAELETRFELDDGGYASRARFSAAAQIDTARDAPLAGTWTDVDSDGPFWSMLGPLGLPVQHDVRITAWTDAGSFASALVARRMYPANVTVTPINTNGVVGELYMPAGAGPFAAVLTFGGSEGGITNGRTWARALVAEGVATMAIAYFGTTGVPADLHLIPLEYFRAALQVLRAQPNIRTDRIAILGSSRGGEAALLVASAFPSEVQATIATVPSGYVWPAWGYWTSSSWRQNDAGLTFLPWGTGSQAQYTNDAGFTVVIQEPLFTTSLMQATAPQLAAAEIPIERAGGPVLMFTSTADAIWPSCRLGQVAWNRLTDAGHQATWPLDSYDCFAGSGHAVNPSRVGVPIAPLLERNVGGNTLIASGGSARDTAHACRVARTKTQALLEWLKR